MKWQVILIMMLLMIGVVNALKDCTGIMLPSKDLPCIIFGTWTPPNPCNTYEAKIFNEVPTLLGTRTLGDYGNINRCNTTFGIYPNETKMGSYFINFTYGDSMRVVLQGEDKMASLSVMLFVCSITFALFFIGIKFNFSKNPVANFIFKRVIILLGLFLLSLDTAIIVTMADNAGLGVNRELFRYLWMINWTIYLFMIWLMWNTIVNVLKLWERLSKEKRMGTNE